MTGNLINQLPADFRTSEVADLLTTMQRAGEWDRTPILLDAIRDAGAPESLMRVPLMWWILAHPDDDAPRLDFADFLEENGEPELSEFVRVQVELEQTTKCSLTDYDLLFKRREGCRCCLLRIRERELFSAHGAEWFGPNATLDPPRYITRPTHAFIGPIWQLQVARGFPAHWYGSWEQWLGGVCIRCDGDGRAHGADRPFEWSADVEYGKCVVCKGSGRITGACETLAWRPTWEMECGACGGFGEFRRRHDNGDGPEGPCPECGGKWLSGPFLDPDDYWDSGSGRVPRPCPQGAVPLTDVTLTTMPDMEWMIAASVRHSRVISNDHKAQCEAEWPGLTFHLPAN